MLMAMGGLDKVIDNLWLTKGMAVKVESKALRCILSVELPVIVPSDPRLPLLKPAQIRSRARSAFSAAIICRCPQEVALEPSDSKLSCTNFVSNLIRNDEIYSPRQAGQLLRREVRKV